MSNHHQSFYNHRSSVRSTPRKNFKSCVNSSLLLACLTVGHSSVHAQSLQNDATENPSAIVSLNPSGFAVTISTNGPIDLNNEFFQVLGTNGRSCSTCHVPQEGWTVTPRTLRERFERTRGTDPIFSLNDGANSPSADISTLAARRQASSMLLNKGVIRIGLPIPAGAEFELIGVDDPYHFASASELSLFRRPLASTNLKFLSAVQWDGRETFKGQPIHFDLGHQADSANRLHAQATTLLTDAQKESIVNFEAGLLTAQVFDNSALWLFAKGGLGGPENEIQQEFYIGINDLLGDSQTGAPFNPVVFNLYDAWSNRRGGPLKAARASVARGQQLFNVRPIQITGVAGINDEPSLGSKAVFNGTCTTCHNSPNGGNHSIPAPVNIGVSDGARRTPDMPLYTLRNLATGQTVQTTDPGRALVTGKWKDVNRFKSSTLRGLAGRAPFFHDGSARTLKDVVDFYDTRFAMGLSDQDKQDLVAFMRTL